MPRAVPYARPGADPRQENPEVDVAEIVNMLAQKFEALDDAVRLDRCPPVRVAWREPRTLFLTTPRRGAQGRAPFVAEAEADLQRYQEQCEANKAEKDR